ncbi:type I polyketide synthase [Myxacorys almedinensis]|uniref:SDR family NAD(P)-dependent oxidoreductase n=1 Tax=Myxacorys almedinensis A TaxID=2690445 RepID=A0A8J7Z790_9CYAN|nr:type I polyketide synthase [Myxacorys almedinensis]NDJ19426.1 SDR family NAD(P)-dependent oxidoreductase [Myxacorys almedinensis A]
MEPIAIIGIGCRFPGARDPESFWQLLHNGVDSVSEIPRERWDVDAFYDPEPGTPGKMSTRYGGFLEQVDRFDPAFFGISPREVERMDPQQRLVLEVAWEALENAGIIPAALGGTQTGVFMGIGNYDYCRILARDLSRVNAYDGTGNTLSIAANRLSYILNLRGPSVVIETACSSSLVALHFACRSLQSRESDVCLVGGVSLMLSPEPFITYSHARMMAPDGRCKTFDASADGYVRGEGCGMVVLKRLSDAREDADNILAVMRGTAINQDGLSNGLTAPNGPSQQAVIRQALDNAGVAPAQISYVETHGTGTPLGDPIEVKSLKAVLMRDRKPDQPCWLGSVKTNIGHLEAASGIASVIKVALAMQHREIPPHLHLKQLNPYISLEGTPLAIPTERQPWLTEERFAGISAFGFGGTNCHVVLEAADSGLSGVSATPRSTTQDSSTVDRPLHVLTLSAKDETALQALAQRYADFLATHSDVSLSDVCFTANTTRSQFDHRLAIVAESADHLRDQLAAFAAVPAGLVKEHPNGGKKRPKIAFLFTGQGSQYVGMGRQLYETQPMFRQALDRCDAILRSYLDIPLLEILYADSGSAPKLDETAYTQPALFALEYSLYQLWRSWGIEPAIVMGHSVGEYVAACVAGVFSLEDGLKLIAARARLMQALPQDGEMVAVFATEGQVAAAIQPYTDVAIAAINGAQSIVMSGRRQSVEAAIATLNAQGIKTRKLNVSHAFHSPLMEPMLDEFKRVAAEVSYSSPTLKFVSNLTGELATDQVATPEYWCQHVRQPVRFATGMETLYEQKYNVFVEIGAKPTLIGMARADCEFSNANSNTGNTLSDRSSLLWLASLTPKQADWQQILESLTVLYERGVAVDWAAFDRAYPRRRLHLPTYPFQRQRYWVDIPENGVAKTPDSIPHLLNSADSQQLIQQLETTGSLSAEELSLLPKLLELLTQQTQKPADPIEQTAQNWLYEIEWQLKPRTSNRPSQESGCWLILADKGGIGDAIAQRLRDRAQPCILVYPGETYEAAAPGTFSINPAERADFERLLTEGLATLDHPLRGILHLWSVEPISAKTITLPSLEQAQILGVGSVLHLLQTLQAKFTAALPRLWLVTQGAVPVDASLRAVAQAPLWGLGKVVALEHPDLWGGLIDLPADAIAAISSLQAELEDAQEDDQIALRDGQRYVARLVQKPVPAPQEAIVRAAGTYLITGGLGALGLKVAQWLVEKGARQLVLMARREPSSEAQETLCQLEQIGAKIVVAQADVTCAVDVSRMLEDIQAAMPPLRGIIHAAGVLDDGILLQQNWAQFTRVMHPKVQGAWNLHTLTQTLPLDFFVLFSSAASLLGSPGQGNYAAANAFLDALAHHRRSQKLPGLSINWGAWSDIGMAATLSSRHQARLATQGLSAIAPEQGLYLLGQLLGQPLAQVGVLPVEWSVFGQQFSPGQHPPLLSELLRDAHPNVAPLSAQQREFLQRLQSASEGDRQPLLKTYLQEKAAKVLGLTTSAIDTERSLHDLGLDSLMAVELTSLIRTDLQVDLPVRALIEDPSIANLAALLAAQLNPEGAKPEETTVLDLSAEAVLDPSINPANAIIQPAIAPTSILLTGATGFLGAFLLHDLLEQTQAEIYCLVRSTDAESAKIRLQKNLESYDLWNERFSSRIILVLGDLAQPQLGLSAEQFETLASQIDSIYHNGALLNYIYPYSKFKPINVLGTQEILKLACQIKVKPVHYISSVAVFESSAYYGKKVTEADVIDRSEGIYLGYSQSKWVSEKLVQIASDRGLPVTIYRPPLVSGHSKTGVWNTDGFLCRMIQGCIQMGSIMTDLDLMLDLSPVDYNSQAIVYLSKQKSSIGKVFHLQNPHLLHWSQLVEFICSLGYPMEKVSFQEWQVKLSQARDNPLYPLIPFFGQKWSEDQLTYIELNQQDKRPQITCEATIAALAGSSIDCPPQDAQLLSTYFSYFIRSGFLEAPKVGISSK